MICWPLASIDCILVMEHNDIVMYNSKILTPGAVTPEIRYSNYQDVRPGTVWGPRKIGDFELILIVSGTFYYDVPEGGERLILPPGVVLCIPPGELHIFGIEKTEGDRSVGTMSCIHLELEKDKSFLNGDYMPEPAPPYVTDIGRDYAVHELFRKLSFVHSTYSRYRLDLEELCAKEIWIRLSEYWISDKGGGRSARIRNIISFLEDNYSKNISRRELAKKFHLAPEYINHIFRKETGVTPTEFIHSLRIREGCRLIQEEGLSIKEAAHRTGFCDEFYFSRIFKRIMKIPPGSLSVRKRNVL